MFLTELGDNLKYTEQCLVQKYKVMQYYLLKDQKGDMQHFSQSKTHFIETGCSIFCYLNPPPPHFRRLQGVLQGTAICDNEHKLPDSEVCFRFSF